VKENWHPYTRNEETLARNWAIPGTPGFEHRIGGLEKSFDSGDISYEPENHEKMTFIRGEKIERVKNNIPNIELEFAQSGDLLVIGWGGTYGSLHSAIKDLAADGYSTIGYAHFNYINPMPKNTKEILSRFKKIIVCELNSGQFVKILKINFDTFKFLQYNKIQGMPFSGNDLSEKFKQLVD